MNVKRLGALALCLALLAGLMTVPQTAGAVESGVYTASMVTSYYNPDTGNVDDGGTANAALGEGMCRSATAETCLVEVDGSDVWVTVRLLLQSNCSNVALYTRSGYDSYSQVTYSIPSEDAGNDSIDYRIKVSEAGQWLKCTMYVAPMGRDVLWYLHVDVNTLTSGSGDFVVNIDTSKHNQSSSAGTSANKNTSGSSSAGKSTTSGSKTATQDQTKTDTAAEDTKDDGEETETPEEAETTEEETDAETQETETAEDPAQETGEEEAAAEEEAAQDAEDSGSSAGIVAVVLIVIIIAAVLGAWLWKRKKK